MVQNILLDNYGNEISLDINGFNKLTVKERLIAIRRLSAKDKMDIIIESVDAHAIVTAMPVEELFYLIKEIGEHDALELIALASAEQIKIMIDIDCWYKDSINIKRFIKWLKLLIACGDIKLLKTIKSVDLQLFVIMLKDSIKVYMNESDDETKLYQKDGLTTLDNIFYYQVICGNEEGEIIDKFIKKLFHFDYKSYLTMMYEAIYELEMALIEESYSMKNSRLACYGFPEYEEALGLYSFCRPMELSTVIDNNIYIEPSVSTSEYFLYLPSISYYDINKELFLNRVLSQTDIHINIQRFQSEMVYLFNCLLMLEIKNHSDLDNIKEIFKKGYITLSLGLESLCMGDLSMAASIISKYRLFDIFRTGYSRKILIRKKAQDIVNNFKFIYNNKDAKNAIASERQEGRISYTFFMLDSPYRNVLKGALSQTPVFFYGIEDTSLDYREFSSINDCNMVEYMLDEIKDFDVFFYRTLHFFLEDLAKLDLSKCLPNSLDDITLGTIFLTAMANEVLFGRFECTPIKAPYLKELYIKTVGESHKGGKLVRIIKGDIKDRVMEKIKDRTKGECEGYITSCIRFMELAFNIFNEEFASIKRRDSTDIRFFKGLIVELT